MVDSCQEEKVLPANCFSAVLVVVYSKAPKGAEPIATVDHSDIRGLVTA